MLFFFKQKTAYDMRISDWSSDSCSSDLPSLVSASLSRVCEEASTNRFSKRLSLISAWRSEDSPWVTLTKSYTTRRSQPMTRSRSEERRVGQEGVSTCRSRWKRYHSNNKTTTYRNSTLEQTLISYK